MSKAIYQPKNKAAEYAEWACNFYVGCSCQCHYCYLRKGRGAAILGGNKPQLKKCFKGDNHAFEVFLTEMNKNIVDLQKHGVFFSFTTDPMLPETIDLTLDATSNAVLSNIPVKILTKCTSWIDGFLKDFNRHEINLHHVVCPDVPFESKKHLYAFGFTLTGHDELEPGASTNAERIKAMRRLHDAGFKTWASIEPIIDLPTSFKMICDTNCICCLYKIGLESGKKYDKKELINFIDGVIYQVVFYGAKVYFKDSLLKAAGINRASLPENCVSRDYNMFES